MHAASVHPEPGSNSQTIVYLPLSRLDPVWAIYSSFFYFLELCSLWFWQILYSHLQICFVLLSSVVQLSSFDPLPCESLSIISHPSPLVNTFFQFFSNFFSTRFDLLWPFAALFRDSFTILSLLPSFVKPFFYFSLLLVKNVINPTYLVQFCAYYTVQFT